MQFTVQRLFKIGFAGVTLYVIVLTAGLLKVFILAILLAFMAAPLSRFLQRGKYVHKLLGDRPGVAAAAAFMIIFLLLWLLLWFICAPLIREFWQFYAELPLYLHIFKESAAAAGQNFIVPLAGQFDLKERLEYLLLFIEGFAADGAGFIVQMVQKMTVFSLSAAGRIFDLAVIPVLAFYFLRDYVIMLDGFLKLFSRKTREKVHDFARALGKMLADFVYGQLVLCLAVGFCMFAGLSLLGVKYPLLLGAAAAVFEAVPVIGPFISAVPAVVLALTVSPKLAGQTALFCLALQLAENNFLAPRIMGRSLHLPPAVILLSLLIGGNLFGIIGMFASLPAAAGIRLLLEYFWNSEDV